jgi:hypothetical protein
MCVMYRFQSEPSPLTLDISHVYIAPRREVWFGDVTAMCKMYNCVNYLFLCSSIVVVLLVNYSASDMWTAYAARSRVAYS